MPEVRATRSVDRPLAEIWAYVQDFDNWAPMLDGYVNHAQESDRVSLWTLKGDVGPLSKTVQLRVEITEWTDAQRIAFTLNGVGEDVAGQGAFDLHEERPELPAPVRTWWDRLLDWLFSRTVTAPVGPATSHVVFTFGIHAGGPMAPMINAMLGPYTEQVASGLLDRVAEHLEEPSDD